MSTNTHFTRVACTGSLALVAAAGEDED